MDILEMESFIPDDPNLDVDPVEILGLCKPLLQLIAITIEEAVMAAIEMSERIKDITRSHIPAFPADKDSIPEVWNLWNRDMSELQTRLHSINLKFSEECCSIFAHRFFLLGVYKYPQFSYEVARLLDGFFKNPRNSKLPKEKIKVKLLNNIFMVLNKTTIYDDLLDPPYTARLQYLFVKFPILNSIKKDPKILRKKLQVRHMNAAYFLGNLLLTFDKQVYANCLRKFLICMLSTKDVAKFLAIHQVLSICGHLCENNLLLNECLSALSNFLEGLNPNHPKKPGLQGLLKEMTKQFGKSTTTNILDRLVLNNSTHESKPDLTKTKRAVLSVLRVHPDQHNYLSTENERTTTNCPIALGFGRISN